MVVAALLTATLSACSGADDTAGPTPAPGTLAPTTASPGTSGATVHDLRALPRNRWSSDALTIAVGDSVRVTDTDPDAPHNFVVAGVGQSATMQEGDVFTLRFPKAGTFDFVCTFHEAQMTGTVTVR